MPISSYAGGVRPTRRSIWRPTPYAPHHPEAYAQGRDAIPRPTPQDELVWIIPRCHPEALRAEMPSSDKL